MEVRIEKDSFQLNIVVMPLVRLMEMHHEFSWANREEIAWAIAETIREHEALHDECNRVKSPSESEQEGRLEVER